MLNAVKLIRIQYLFISQDTATGSPYVSRVELDREAYFTEDPSEIKADNDT